MLLGIRLLQPPGFAGAVFSRSARPIIRVIFGRYSIFKAMRPALSRTMNMAPKKHMTAIKADIGEGLVPIPTPNLCPATPPISIQITGNI